MRFILVPLLMLGLAVGGLVFGARALKGEADGATVTRAQFAKVRLGMPRDRVETLLGGAGVSRDRYGRIGEWLGDRLKATGEPAGTTCVYYADPGTVTAFRVCFGPRGRVASRTVIGG